MAASVTITLDVTPPTPLLGLPYRLPASNRIAIPYVVDEPAIDSAEVNAITAEVEPAEIISTQAVVIAGNLSVTGIARDDVGNQRTFSFVVFIGPLTSQGLRVAAGGIPRLDDTRVALA